MNSMRAIENPNLSSRMDSKQPKHKDFEREMMPHMAALYNFALRMTNDPDDAKDLIQETYLRAYRYLDKYEQGTNAKAWLFQIMRNVFINLYRKESNEPVKIDYDVVKDVYLSIKDAAVDTNDLQEKFFGDLFEDEVAEALHDLPEDFRTIIILYDVEEYTYEEIADFIEIPIGTVRSRLHRGRKKLCSMLRNYAIAHGITDDKDETRELQPVRISERSANASSRIDSTVTLYGRDKLAGH